MLTRWSKHVIIFTMNDEIIITIESLTRRVAAKEEEANKLKKLVNELCAEAGIAAKYAKVTESGAVNTSIRSDQFYGVTITAAIRNYLEQRKAAGLGAAGLNEIYSAVRDGGYKFESKNENNAKVSVGNTLRKSSSIFHRLPNGQYGLLEWYPSAKAKPEADTVPKRKSKKESGGANKTAIKALPEKAKNDVTSQEIRDVILGQEGQFQATNIETAIKEKFPTKDLPPNKISGMFFILKGKGLIKEISPRNGPNGAVFAKV